MVRLSDYDEPRDAPVLLCAQCVWFPCECSCAGDEACECIACAPHLAVTADEHHRAIAGDD